MCWNITEITNDFINSNTIDKFCRYINIGDLIAGVYLGLIINDNLIIL